MFADIYELTKNCSFYKANKYGLQNTNKHATYRLIYGEYIRLFCRFCTHYKAKRCKLCKNDDVEKICFNHPNCKDCQQKRNPIKCSVCLGDSCADCLYDLDEDHEEICISCINQQEIREFKHILCTKFYWENIVSIISEYSVGAVVKCCNNECKEEIVFDFKLQFLANKDNNNASIYYYKPKYLSENQGLVQINDKKLRMFCAYCTLNCIQNCKWCLFKDCQQNCVSHPICCKCQVRGVYRSVCKKCNGLFCQTCCIVMELKFGHSLVRGIFCEACVSKHEHERLFKILNFKLKTVLNSTLIHLLTEFCTGYAIQCCNRDVLVCDNYIVFENMFQFESITKRIVYYYEPRHPKPNKPTVLIYEKKLRIFCERCTLDELKPCLLCSNKETGLTECGMHPHCKSCSAVLSLKLVCSKCKEHFCTKCLFKKYGHYGTYARKNKQCKSCNHQAQVQKLALDLEKSLVMIPHLRKSLFANIIACYAVGYIVKCCNLKCTNDIIFDNDMQFNSEKDFENKVVYYYEPKYCDETRPSVLINQQQVRVFCNECTSTLIQNCTGNYCRYQDLPGLCAMHPLCGKCKTTYASQNQLKKCNICKLLLCKNCYLCMYGSDNRIYCETCAVKNEYEEIFEVILNVCQENKYTKDTFVIDVITGYCMGYAFICGNEDMPCCNEIIFDNMYQFMKKTDNNESEIYYYCVKHLKKNKAVINHPLIENRKLRIFCSKCTNLRIRPCKKCLIYKESGERTCLNHPNCKSCNVVLYMDPSPFCGQCKQNVCQNCLYYNNTKCKSCVTTKEINKLTNVILKSLKTWKFFELFDWKNISLIIAKHCVGFAFNCCNVKECDNEIVFDNQLQFDTRRDCKNRVLKSYEPDFFSANRPIITLLQDKNRRLRLFCYYCSQNRIQRCDICGTWQDVETICGRHPICSKCNIRVKRSGTIKCCICFESYCESCCYSLGYDDDIIYCKICLKKFGYDDLYGVIYDLLSQLGLGFDIHIIGIMMDYCIGYAFECCNEENKCGNDVAFDNMFQFRQKQDFNQREIYYYEAKHATHKNKPLVSMNNKTYRMFCAVCTRERIKKCIQCKRNRESGNRLCCNHPICFKCNDIMFDKETKCRTCSKYLCYQKCCIDIVGRGYCKKCALNKELSDLIEIISNSQLVLIMEIFSEVVDLIASIIAEYSVGFLFRCCNKKCQNKIFFDNIWQFKMKINNEKKAIKYRYLARKYGSRNKRAKVIANKPLIILCVECSEQYKYIGSKGQLKNN